MFKLTKQQLDMQVAGAREAERLNQSKPVAWRRRNPNGEHMRWQMKIMGHQNTDFSMATRQTVLSNVIHSSKAPLSNLNSVTLNKMKVPKIHFGKYLVCKVANRPLNSVGVSTLIQDLNGDIEELIVYNYNYNIDDVSWLKEGSIMIIKEPRLRYGMQGKEAVSLRIDSPTDIIFVDPSDDVFLNKIGASKWYTPSSKDVELIRKEANEIFLKQKYDQALMLYDRAIRYEPDLPILYLNKASAFLYNGSFSKAYEAAKLGLEKGGDREKALFRMGMAAYGMKEWQNAINHFEEVLKDFSKHPSVGEELEKAKARLNEKENGKFNFKEMYLASKENDEIDVADYCGPIKIAKIDGKGRGIIATEDIQKGTLLVVSKSFASSYSKDFTGKLISINLIKNNSIGTAAEMLQTIRVMENLQKNPQRVSEVYDLYSGDLDENDEEIPNGYINAARIQKICAFNCFSSEDSIREEKEDSHLFIVPSYFNHSCIANAHRTIYGDVMVIHASTNIKKGDEICLAYCNPMTSARQKRLKDWHFTCQCSLCKVEAEDENCSKRNKIFGEYLKHQNASNDSVIIKKCEPLLKQMREAYAKENPYKIHLAHMLSDLSPLYFSTGQKEKSIKMYEEVLTLMSDPLEYVIDITTVMVKVALCHLSMGNKTKAKEFAQKAFKMSCLTDINHFKLIYPQIANCF